MLGSKLMIRTQRQLDRKRRERQAAFTLVELLVGIVVGSIVVAGAIALYIVVIRGSAFLVQEARVTQDARVVMDFIVQDLRRAGYSHPSRIIDQDDDGVPDNPFSSGARGISIHDFGSGGSRNCILFSYDPTFSYDTVAEDFSQLPSEQFVFGYRLDEATGVVQMLTDASVSDTDSCTAGVWQDLNDSETTFVSGLTFSSVGSTCLNSTLDPTNFQESDMVSVSAGQESGFCESYFSGSLDSSRPNILIESRRVPVSLQAEDGRRSGTRVDIRNVVSVRNNRLLIMEDGS